MTTTTEAPNRIEAALARFASVILAGDTEYVVTMTAFVDNLTGVSA